MSGRCKDCGYYPNSTIHFDRCVYAPTVYVRCVVDGCGVRTTRPTQYGMCPSHLWDERHDRIFAAMLVARRAS